MEIDRHSLFNFEKSNQVQSVNNSPFEIKVLSIGMKGNDHSETFKYQINYEILLIKKGNGHIFLNDQEIGIFDNTVYLLSPGQIFKIRSCEPLSGYMISFNQKALTWCRSHIRSAFYSPDLFSQVSFSIIPLEQDLFANIEIIVLNMIREISGSSTDKEELLHSFLKIIIIYLSRKSLSTETDTVRTNGALTVKKFFKLLNDDFVECKSVREFASQLSITPNYMSEIIKRETGYSAAHHIQQRVIMEAKNIALNPAVNMKTVAHKLGFEDVAHFSKFFKKYSGINFSVYRNHKINRN